MRKALALVTAALLLAACNSTPSPSPSESASATPTASPSPVAVACTYPAEIASILGTPEATATVADFVPVGGDGPDATLLPAGYVSPFAGQKLFFVPEKDADEYRAGRDLAENSTAFGNFVPGSAGGLVNSAIIIPDAKSGALSNLDTNTMIGELGVRTDNFADVFEMLQGKNGAPLDGLFIAPAADGYARIGGIAVGADALYLEFLSSWVNTLASETAMPADFPILAIAHHPSAASAEAAVAWTESLDSATEQIALCVNGVMTDFTVVSGEQIGIEPADLSTRAQTAGGIDLSLAMAAVTVGDQHYVIARAVNLYSEDGVAPEKLVVSAPLKFPEFQLAVWPTGMKK